MIIGKQHHDFRLAALPQVLCINTLQILTMIVEPADLQALQEEGNRWEDYICTIAICCATVVTVMLNY